MCVQSTRAEQPITSVAESRQDVSVCVELAVECCRNDTDVGMLVGEVAKSFGRGDEAEETNACRARSLQRSYGRSGASTGSEHGIEKQKLTFGSITRDLEVVIHRLERVVVSIQADVSDARGRNETQNSFHHSESGPQNRHECQLLATHAVTRRSLEWCVHRNDLERKRDGGFIRQQHREFINKFLEDLGWSVATSQQSDLVLHQWMPHESEVRVLRAGVHVRQGTKFAIMAEYRASFARC